VVIGIVVGFGIVAILLLILASVILYMNKDRVVSPKKKIYHKKKIYQLDYDKAENSLDLSYQPSSSL
jgi:Na+-transporting methylmalonyl-CoA/oxaloacetate decarboxylase gamma subunit